MWPYEADIPSSTQWNAGVQMTLPWASTIDVSYVAQHGFNQLQSGDRPRSTSMPWINAAFLPQNQDPTLPRAARPAPLRIRPTCCGPPRPRSGRFNFPDFHETYHSIQASLNRFRDGIAFGLAYTLGLAEGNIGLLQRLDHSADCRDPRRSGGVRGAEQRHGQPAPPAEGELPVGSAGLALDEPGHESRWPAGERLAALRHPDRRIGRIVATTSPTRTRTVPSEPDRVAQPGHDPHRRRYGKGCSDNQHGQFNVAAFAGPQTEAWDWSRAATTWRAVRTTLDLSIARNIRLGGARQLQLRLDAFNAPHRQHNGA